MSWLTFASIDKGKNYHYVLMAIGWMAEWSKAAVLKTVEVQASGGSNPSPSVLVCIAAVGFSRLDIDSAVSHPQCIRSNKERWPSGRRRFPAKEVYW